VHGESRKDLPEEASKDTNVFCQRLKNFIQRPEISLMRRAAEQFVCLEEWVNRLLEIVKPNEGKFVLNIDVLFSFYLKLKVYRQKVV
jgi:hypothetical protein